MTLNLTPRQIAIVKALSKAFVESEHPRAEDGKFGFKPYATRHPERNPGGNFTLHDKDKQIGHASAQFFHNDKELAMSGKVPAKTAILDSIEVDEKRRGKGEGTAFYKHIESQARDAGMKRIWATSVMSESEKFWTKMGYKHTGRGRIWEKEL